MIRKGEHSPSPGELVPHRLNKQESSQELLFERLRDLRHRSLQATNELRLLDLPPAEKRAVLQVLTTEIEPMIAEWSAFVEDVGKIDKVAYHDFLVRSEEWDQT